MRPIPWAVIYTAKRRMPGKSHSVSNRVGVSHGARGATQGLRVMVFALAAAAFVAALPRTAGAGDAAELIKEGIALRRKGDDAGAREKFQQAHRLQESPRALAQMAP